MVSTTHKEAEYFYKRDLNCIKDLFKRRFEFDSLRESTLDSINVEKRLDIEIGASGVSKKERD
jgi:RIO kinase 2